MIASLFIPILLVSFIVLIVFIVVGIKAGNQKGGEDLIKNVYIYLVLFATLMMTIGGSVGSFMALADIVAPTPYHQTYDDFKRHGVHNQRVGGEEVDQEKIPEEEIREMYERAEMSHRERQIARAQNSLVKSLGWIVIPLPIFMYFQRMLARREDL
ncbi:hypothetical protein GGQ84_000386 [Desulfitispora alkaliphila]|uniref:hypothetical protein n=1 Tax=Desulfitispora alkaliphila TaxID=622674 RepID=UPI003D1CF0DB